MAKLFAGIHRIKLLGSYSYLLEGDGLTLIDAGYIGSGLPLARYLRRAGLRADRIANIILTHAHPDHCGGLNDILLMTGAAVNVHLAEAPLLAGEVVWPNPF